MGTLYENIKALSELKGVTPSRVCVELGFSKNVVSTLKTEKTTTLSFPKVQAFANYFGITVDELLNYGNEKDPADSEVDMKMELAKLKKRTEGTSVYFNGKELDADTIAAINASLDVIEKMLEAR